jgi:hypothetical protein
MGRRSSLSKSQPFSIRLGASAELLVGEEARRTGRSRSALVTELTEEAAKARLFPGIAFRDEPRRAWVIGTGLDVWELIELVSSYEGRLAELREAHPLVSERHVRLATAYAERFPDEIDAFLREQHRPLDELRALYPFIELAE